MRRTDALAVKIRRGEWQVVALALLLGLAEAARTAPPGTIDDVLALLSIEEREARRGR
ncbi:MAG TPA: hypothetical protein VEZ14_09400 [Dehalococcoidia bacterium]|nr:hypothetical protein [Dehalococcoidia bacterium]